MGLLRGVNHSGGGFSLQLSELTTISGYGEDGDDKWISPSPGGNMRLSQLRTASRLSGLTLAIMLIASARISAQRSHVGARIGYDFQSRSALVSTQATVPMTSAVEFYPSLDVYLPDHGSMMGFNGDLKFNLPTSGPHVYLGGGLGVQTRSDRNVSNTNVGANAILGLESRQGWVHPFVEGRAFLSDVNRASLLAGLNFTIGGR
jgi:hypothetical protein